MSNVKFCEFCGAFGKMIKSYVETTSHGGTYWLCEICHDRWDGYALEGDDRQSVLSNIQHGLPWESGPSSCSFDEGDRSAPSLLNSCSYCHRKVSTEGIVFAGEGQGDYLFPSEMRKVLPPTIRNFDSVVLCPLCIEKVIVNFVESLTEEDLHKHSSFSSFSSKDLDGRVKELISLKLQGKSLVTLPTYDNPEITECFNLSLEYLTQKDIELLRKESRNSERDDGKTYKNPLCVAPYEHGFFIIFPNFYFDLSDYELKIYGYSKQFRDIIVSLNKKRDRKGKENCGYPCVKIFSAGPHYQELIQKDPC